MAERTRTERLGLIVPQGNENVMRQDLVDNLEDIDDKVALQSDLENVEQKVADNEEALNEHLADKANPHNVTKEQIGLGNVTNDTQLKKGGDIASGLMSFNAGFTAANNNNVIYSSSNVPYKDGLVFTNNSLFANGDATARGFKFAATGTGTATGSLNIGMITADAPDTFIFRNVIGHDGEIFIREVNRVWHAGIAGPFYRGSGSPEGVITAPVGAIYQRTDGGASTTFYVKESGTGNTGWVAK